MNLAEIVSRHAETTPGASAVVDAARAYSYREFDRAIRRAARALRKQGIALGDVVGMTMGDTALHLVVAYALARAGAVQLVLTRRDSPQLRRQLAARYRAAMVVGDAADARLDGLRYCAADQAWLEDAGAGDEGGDAAPGGDAPWRIVMSSGTTGAPKAVLQTHAMHVAWREIYARTLTALPSDRYLAIGALDYYAGMRQCMDMHWCGACTIVGVPVRSSAELFEAVERHAVNYLRLLSNQLQRLLPALPRDRPRFPGVRVLRSGAMIVPESLRREVVRRLTPNLVVTYGSNDVGSVLTFADAATEARHPGSVGIPSPGVTIEIADEQGRRLPAGEVGLIRARAPGMPAGYIDNPEATAQAFRDGWYYPGDLGLLTPDGVLYFKGRADDLMNFDGIKIYPSDIEEALASHPAVAEAAAFPIASATHQDVPAAAVVLRAEVSQEAIIAWCRERLGSRAPCVIAVVKELPRNAAGKVLKQPLARALGRQLGETGPAGAGEPR
jgi:acyl-coenzyme A synthetase/AMP-(fatty) acid ligase